MFIYQKTIDRSTLRQGFQIPVEFHDLLKAMPGGMPRHGESRDIKLLIDGQEFTAHHLIPFTESMNNDTSNIIILSPSYHRIIHKAKPKWDSKNLSFCFPNGVVEKVKLSRHLNI